MCGICGIYNFSNKKVERDKIEAMKDLMIHRGPDGEGTTINGNVGLGHRRLSIIDLHERGTQPMVDPNSGNWLVYNGEIYNYIELKRELKNLGYKFSTETDTEVILTAFNAWGKAAFPRMNGMFAFCIFDKSRNELICVRDRYGIKPFYYSCDNEQFTFASEIKPIIKVSKKHFKINKKTAFNYLVYGRTDYNNETFFRGLFNLSPGHYMICNAKGLQAEKRWWNPPRKKSKPSLTFLKKIFQDSVKLRMRSDVPVGACLSGGLDSTSIVNTAIRETQYAFSTFSAISEPNWKHNEEKYIKLVTKKQNINPSFIKPSKKGLLNGIRKLVYSQEEPFSTPAVYTQWEVMKLANEKGMKVLLDGQGADEIMCGYHYFYSYYLLELLKKRSYGKFLYEFIQTLVKTRDTYFIRPLIFLLLPEKLQKKVYFQKNNYFTSKFSKNIVKDSDVLGDFIKADTLSDICKNHLKHKLQHLLRYEDKNSMSFSIESRTPFLDYRLVEYCIQSPSQFHINRGFTKFSFRLAMKKTVEDQILQRRDKIGFKTMEEEWLTSVEFKQFFLDIVNSPKFKNRKIFDESKVVNLTKNFIDDKKVDLNLIWRIFNLELWFQEFLDKQILDKRI